MKSSFSDNSTDYLLFCLGFIVVMVSITVVSISYVLEEPVPEFDEYDIKHSQRVYFLEQSQSLEHFKSSCIEYGFSYFISPTLNTIHYCGLDNKLISFDELESEEYSENVTYLTNGTEINWAEDIANSNSTELEEFKMDAPLNARTPITSEPSTEEKIDFIYNYIKEKQELHHCVFCRENSK